MQKVIIKKFNTDEEAREFKKEFRATLGFEPIVAIENGYYTVGLKDEAALEKFDAAVKAGRLIV